ncbi:hypothetical protein [Flavobacterium sp. SORGH_AS_0622]|uniref:hypothetical protein n=1 Tax=Flavobacterium sp. SORGH_AS_0622 TaxID=3041772 RepID=UPI00278391BA|nr:hypothetical protein [Flavobacterium sp. SORGH_AS_0622]MDQ1165677.1 hypothetical protein [Flavobacterium sp. SORGH_AS_0622]
MNQIRLDYPFAVFLYAYLQQIDLSLDRSRWTPLNDLKHYYEMQIAPGRVLKYIINRFDLDRNRIKDVYYVIPVPLSIKIRAWFELYFKRECVLSKEEVYYCCQKLFILDHYLNGDIEVHKLEIEKLRVELSQFTFDVLQSRVFVKDRIKAQRVEHFSQSKNLDVISMKEFSKGLDL